MFRRSSVLDPETVGALETLDAALAGDHYDHEIALIAEEVRASSPAMTPVFAERLDTAIASGFATAPRQPSPSAPRRRWARSALAGTTAAVLAASIAAIVIAGDRTGPTPIAERTAPQAAAQEGITNDDATAKGSPGAAPATTPGASAPSTDTDRARRVERAAALVLAPPASRIQEVADAVVRATDRFGGYVQRSEVNAAGRQGYASLDLRVPVDRLDDALAAYSRLAHVRSRSQSSNDITARFVSAQDRLEDARAERKALLQALGNATTATEADSIRARLRLARSAIARAEGDLAAARRRASTAQVSVQIEPAARGSVAPVGSDDRWTPGDAVGDAGRVLLVVASIAIVAAAALVPTALLAAIALMTARRVRRRRREAALDGASAAM